MPAAPSSDPPEAARRRVVGLLLAGMLLSQMISNMVSVAVPTMLTDLGASLEQAGWIISAFLLPMAVLMPTWGAAGDLYGRRRVFRLGLVLFGLGAVVSALAGSLPHLLVGQVIQAAGASALNPNGTAIIAESGGAQGRGRALGRLRMILSLSGIVGAPIGGLLVQLASWHSIFLAGPVVAVTVAAWLGRLGPETRPVAPSQGRFDVAGALLLTATMLALLIALSLGPSLGWAAPPVLGLAAATLVGLALLGLVEARQPRPLIPPALFRHGAFAAVVVTCFLQAFACFGTALLGPLLLQRGFGLEPSLAGWLMASYPIGMAASGIPGGRLTDRFGGQVVTAASLLGVAVGLGLLTLAARLGQPALFVPGALVTGFAAGIGLTAMSAFVLQISGIERRGVAMGVYTMISIMGDAVGVALLPQLLAGQTGANLATAFGAAYLVAAGAALLALAPTLAMRVAPATSAEPVIASPVSEIS